MATMNESFLNLEKNYLFIEISKRVKKYTEENPNAPVIRMGIGDVTLPLVSAVVEAGKKAFDEMGVKETFRGYEDSGRGYDFLRDAVSGYYKSFGADVPSDEIFISDGAKSDTGNISDIFANDSTVVVTDPAYPVYVDSNIMGGKTVLYANADETTNFSAKPDPTQTPDLIYLCSPNNPTGAAFTFDELQTWVDYAISKNAIIIYDAAYEAFITEADKPRSIFLIKNARNCAIEICSLSKTAGFTGVRCGYTVIPKDLYITDSNNSKHSVLDLWARRQGSKFNGVSYPVQRAAEAVFTQQGQHQIQQSIAIYQKNAKIITDTLTKLNISFTGGINAPYIWFKCPNNLNSWEFFDLLLEKANVVGTPGEGFGKNGKDRFRLTAFNTEANTVEAMKRLTALIGG